MIFCPDCHGTRFLIFRAKDRYVCAWCGFLYPADDDRLCDQCAAAEADLAETAAVEADLAEAAPLQVYFQQTSDGKTQAFTYREGGKLKRVSVAHAEDMLADGRAEQITVHPTKG